MSQVTRIDPIPPLTRFDPFADVEGNPVSHPVTAWP
jgi:hypothetical protein